MTFGAELLTLIFFFTPFGPHSLELHHAEKKPIFFSNLVGKEGPGIQGVKACLPREWIQVFVFRDFISTFNMLYRINTLDYRKEYDTQRDLKFKIKASTNSSSTFNIQR